MFSIGSSEREDLTRLQARDSFLSSISLASGLEDLVGVVKFLPESCFCSVIVDEDGCYRS